jgi:hypothetical protein
MDNISRELIAFALMLDIATPISFYLVSAGTYAKIFNRFWDWKDERKIKKERKVTKQYENTIRTKRHYTPRGM